jgi:molybdopterin-guanine dinucleotide biosynthesis protein A
MSPAGPLLGAIIAGGVARRFGSDKAAALLQGRALLDHVAEALRHQVDHLVVVGRDWPGLERVDDVPTSRLGPLGGICGALSYATEHGYDAVLTAGCDTLPLPPELAISLGTGPAVLQGQHLIGVWPATLRQNLHAHLLGQLDHAVRGWIAASGARVVDAKQPFANLNTPQDLARYELSLSSSWAEPR